jgi:dethiobiotin synthase
MVQHIDSVMVQHARPRGLFITGTDTGVGKTVVSAALMHRYRPGIALRYWKPIQTGIEQDDDTADVERLGDCRPDELRPEGIRLPRPVSPHLAARLNGTTIALRPLVDSMVEERRSVRWIVEGAGGVLVPINDAETMIDLISLLGLPVIVVARTALGTINHTLLTLEALGRRALDVAGIVMVGDRNTENRAAIERYGAAVVIGEMPRFTRLAAADLAAWAAAELDPQRRLLEWLE